MNHFCSVSDSLGRLAAVSECMASIYIMLKQWLLRNFVNNFSFVLIAHLRPSSMIINCHEATLHCLHCVGSCESRTTILTSLYPPCCHCTTSWKLAATITPKSLEMLQHNHSVDYFYFHDKLVKCCCISVTYGNFAAVRYFMLPLLKVISLYHTHQWRCVRLSLCRARWP